VFKKFKLKTYILRLNNYYFFDKKIQLRSDCNICQHGHTMIFLDDMTFQRLDISAICQIPVDILAKRCFTTKPGISLLPNWPIAMLWFVEERVPYGLVCW